MHQNVQCIKNKVLELELYINALEQKPNLICLTEHWLKPAEEDFIKLEGYKMVSSFSRLDMAHGGACIFSTEHDFEEITGIKEISIEGHIECACVKSNKNKIIVLCIYRSNLGDFDAFIEKLGDIFDKIQLKYKTFKIVLCGDFNVNLMENSNQTQVFLDLISANNMSQTIFQPTRVTKNTATLLDNIFVNFNNYVNCEVLKSTLSDHYAQLLVTHKTRESAENVIIKKRVFSRNKLSQYRHELECVQWETVLNSKDTNKAYEIFINNLKTVMTRVFLIKKFKVNGKKSKKWITNGIRTSCKKKRMLYEQVVIGLLDKETYNRYTYILRKVINQAKRLSNGEYIINSENKTKATWSTIKNITEQNGRYSKDTILDSLESTGLGAVEVLNEANKYFINSCPNTNINTAAEYKNIKKCSSSIFLSKVDPDEVCQTIKQLKNKKSVGEDEIPVCILKEVADLIAQPLAHIINLAFCTGVYPEGLKTAYVKAIHKKGRKDELKNYRPISLLSNINKIVEKIIYVRLVAFLERNTVLTECQNGFRKGKSTIRAIYMAMVKILESLNQDKNTITMCLDLSKAFDSVDHEILCRKLELYGVRGVALSLLQSYLSNRKQRVVEMDKNREMIKSNTTNIMKGVPQGSILGPLLYILYTNELPKVVEQSMVMYADDTSLIFSEIDEVSCQQSAGGAMCALDKWFSANNLLLNIEKTQIVNFSYRPSKSFKLNFKNNEIESSNSVSFLGVHIDQRLDWRAHIEVLALGIARYSYALKIITDNVGQKEALIAYNAYVQAKMKYGIIFWGNSTEIQRLLILQKRCMRNIFKIKQRDSCKEIFITNKVLTIIGLYIYEAVVFILENRSFFNNNEHIYNTRNKENLKIEKTNYTYLQKNVKYTIIKIWNKIPIVSRNLPKEHLKKQLKTYLQNKAYYSLNDFLNECNMPNL